MVWEDGQLLLTVRGLVHQYNLLLMFDQRFYYLIALIEIDEFKAFYYMHGSFVNAIRN